MATACFDLGVKRGTGLLYTHGRSCQLIKAQLSIKGARKLPQYSQCHTGIKLNFQSKMCHKFASKMTFAGDHRKTGCIRINIIPSASSRPCPNVSMSLYRVHCCQQQCDKQNDHSRLPWNVCSALKAVAAFAGPIVPCKLDYGSRAPGGWALFKATRRSCLWLNAEMPET